jgi:hypothetical protein
MISHIVVPMRSDFSCRINDNLLPPLAPDGCELCRWVSRALLHIFHSPIPFETTLNPLASFLCCIFIPAYDQELRLFEKLLTPSWETFGEYGEASRSETS